MERFFCHSALKILLAALVGCTVPTAFAQGRWPERLVTMVVPNLAGGAMDTMGRVVGRRLSEQSGVPVVVDNKAGASGLIGLVHVAKARPDGQSFLISSSGAMIFTPLLQADLPYDPVRSFDPITQIVATRSVLIVGAGSPYHTVRDLVVAARANPEAVTCASTGTGTQMHLLGVFFGQRNGIRFTHVP